MSGDAENPAYRAEAKDALHMQPLDLMTLIYHIPSGITHMVAAPIPQILEVMAGDILNIDAVVERLSDQFELEEAGDVRALVTERMLELEQLGLVSKVHG